MRRLKRDTGGGYRGRRTSTDHLRVIAIALAVAVVLVLAALLYGQRYIVYTDEGLRLELPFFHREEPERSLPDPGDVSYTEEPAGPMGEETARIAGEQLALHRAAVRDTTVSRLLVERGLM